jgi:heme oxygenase
MSSTAASAIGAAGRLREATREVHRLAETEPFVVDLMEGHRDAAAYARLAGQLRVVYGALEAELVAARAAAPPGLAALLDPRLDRAAALDADLRVLGGHGVAALLRPLPATADYVARIRVAAGSWPRLVAHHYVRYLGDLSGGQVIAAMLRRHYGVPAEALTFFAFDSIGSKGAYKALYRERLDDVLGDGAAYAEALAETHEAYAANRALFAALDAGT